MNLGELAKKISNSKDVYLPVFVVLSVIMLVIPLPTWMIDVLLAMNISLAVVVLLTSFYIKEALEFSVFPTVVLIATVFRLALNVSTTRAILLDANAGSVIKTFGNFVVKGNYVVGFIIFIILVLINYLVITNGAQRIGEVSARFTLDAMPGKQMSIDADLGSGLITEDEARAKRKKLEREADFFGAMDGAGRFVKQDAIAGLIISLINIVAGLVLGIVQHQMSAIESLKTYTLLTVGDGLVSQIPAYLISVATGLIITNAVTEEGVNVDVLDQLRAYPKVMMIAAGFVMLLFFIPGMPKVPLMIIASALIYMGYMTSKISPQDSSEAVEGGGEATGEKPEEAKDELATYFDIDPIELEIGYSLIPIVDPEDERGELLDRIKMLRKMLANEYGLVIPSIRIRDNIQLKPNEYVFKINGTKISKGDVMINYLLAIGKQENGNGNGLDGIPTKEPTFGLDAMWISEDQKSIAEAKGYTVVDPVSVVSTHLTETLKRHLHELLDRQTTQELLDRVKERYPTVIEELKLETIGVGVIQKVLQALLKEGVPIKNIVQILETMADNLNQDMDVDTLVAYVRVAIGRQICNMLLDDDGYLDVITLDATLEQKIANSIQQTSLGNYPALDLNTYQTFISQLNNYVEKGKEKSYNPIVLTNPRIRVYVFKLTEKYLPSTRIISFSEVPADINIRNIGSVKPE